MRDSDLDVSMVIPAYNEQTRLPKTLTAVMEYFSKTPRSHEVIVVDDGSSDETARLVREFSLRWPSIKLLRLPRNMGKGAAVRAGVLNSLGRFIVFNDADGATPPAMTERLLAALEEGADVAIGSRDAFADDRRVERTWRRALIGGVFSVLVNLWVVRGIRDTQCGFKMFRRHVAYDIFERQRIDGFAFDVEVLRLARVLRFNIVPVPIDWTEVPGSKVRIGRDACRMLWDILRVRYLVPESLRPVQYDALERTR
jgi:dolichyl-phosphate beta-glucosyltransferase